MYSNFSVYICRVLQYKAFEIVYVAYLLVKIKWNGIEGVFWKELEYSYNRINRMREKWKLVTSLL